MRPGRPDDLPAVIALWQADVRGSRRDSLADATHLRRLLGEFDWGSRSRVVESGPDAIDGAVLVTDRATPNGTVAGIDVTVGDGRPPDLFFNLARWGLALSRAAGAAAAQVSRGRGHTAGFADLGVELVRLWWRMDRGLEGGLSDPVPVAGFILLDGEHVGRGQWEEIHNRAFADHWRFSPRSEEELVGDRPPRLSLLVTTPDGWPAALTLCKVETYAEDPRPQPVGAVNSVGTLPEHRRKGLASWLVAESLVRLREAGARHCSLHVDAWNSTGAVDVYRKQGFELAFETEVWEATFP